jgi:hypothetical protein
MYIDTLTLVGLATTIAVFLFILRLPRHVSD